MKNILLVEDEFIIAQMIANHLQNMGYSATDIAMSGENALKMFNEKNFDLLLVDVKLNGEIDGIETVEKIRKTSSVPVIYLSGNSDKQTISRSRHTKPIDYMIKPLKMDLLQQVIERALNGGR
ncbi:MAG: response regulator [Balneolales bacterium]